MASEITTGKSPLATLGSPQVSFSMETEVTSKQGSGRMPRRLTGKVKKAGLMARKSMRMSMAYKIHKSYDNSASSIYHECSEITGSMLGIKWTTALYFSAALSAIMKLFSAAIISSLIMMLYGSYVTTLKPASIASFLLIYALFVAFASALNSVIIKKSGRHFFLNCKHCILKKGKNLSLDAEIDILNDVTCVQDLLINRWTSSLVYGITEFVSIFCILFFDKSLFGYACLLFTISKVLSTCQDWIQLREQDHFNHIQLQQDDKSFSIPGMEDDKEDVSWFKDTLGGHNPATLVYAAYSCFMPVLFLYIALNACIDSSSSSSADAIPLSKAISSCVFFFMMCYSAAKQHGNTEHMIKNCFHGYKLMKFNEESGGSVFTKASIASYQEDRPNVTCSASAKSMSSVEMVGYGLTITSMIGLFVTFILIVKAGFEIGENSSFCSTVPITCSHVPDDGSQVSFTAETHFSVTEGCTIEASADDLLKRCASEFVALENEADEVIEITNEDEETDDVAAAELAIQDIGSEILATPTASNTNVGGTVVIAASYTNWRSTKQTFQQTFTVDGVSDSAIAEEGRRTRRSLTSSSAELSVSGTSKVTTDVDEGSDGTSYSHVLTFTVGTGRFDGSKDEITVSLVGSNGIITAPISIGKKFVKGEQRIATISTPKSLGTITSVELVSSGKDGLKFKKIEIDGTHEGGMKGYVKCRGSKRKGTWSCLGVVPIMPISGGGCIAECDPTQQPDVPSLSGVVTFDSSSSDFDELTYPFGKVWNSCSVKGPMKFTYDAKCDTGCEARAHSFKIPDAVVAGFDADSKAEKGKDGGCQQDSTAAYPEWCLQPLKDGAPWSMEGLSSSERKAQCNEKVAHDRGHQIPANNFDHDKDIITATNYMTNIMPQAAQMNRGAWLKTEMLVECWRNYLPTLVFGGAVLLGDGGTTLADIPEWGGYDRSDWFVASHGVKNPAYFWKVLVTGADPSKGEDIEQHIAFWIPNHESASNSNTKDYIVSIDELEANLAKFGETISFNMAGKGEKWADVWELNPPGQKCSVA